MEENKELTLEERIKNLRSQQEQTRDTIINLEQQLAQSREIFTKIAGALEVLNDMKPKENATADQ